MADIRLNINGKEVTGHKGDTILTVAQANGIEIPTLCYDERVKIYGSCGLCVVEVEGIPKLLRSCATEISNGMVIKTNSERIAGSRQMALELLLSDHVGDCRPPCVVACPGSTDCQGYVGLIANGQYKEALELIKEQLPLPASIGRVCPHPCEDACRRQLADEPISIAWLKSFVADIDLKDEEAFMPTLKPATGKNIAVIGGGPGGLTAAYYLAKEGHGVTIFESMPKLGGMLRYGIPQYRLPKEILDKEIAIIEKMGVKMMSNTKIGKDIAFNNIREGFDAVYVSIGAWSSSKLNCPGEDLEGVIGGINFLGDVATNTPIKTGARVAIVGGGNTAMDACRTAIRLGAKEVYNIYRRTKAEMPAEDIEIKEAEEEGVIFKFLVNPIEVIGNDGKVSKVRLQKMKQGEPDASGRRRPIPMEGEEEILDVDSVIVAIGQETDPAGFEEINLTRRGTIAADENTFLTNLEGVFAGGDATNQGASIAIAAIGESKKAAQIICSYLEGAIIPYKEPFIVERDDLTEADFSDREKLYRPTMKHLSPEERKHNFEEIMAGYTEEDAKKDAMRCLECGCHDYFECKLVDLANQYDVAPQRLAGEVHHREFEDDHPFILRNPDKCILCGLCARVCEEVMGISALGLVDRGFDTIVKPALNQPLKETGCISCGQCISVCPTGALGERLSIQKSVPVQSHVTPTVCSHCSVGCHVNLSTKGNLLVRSLPDKESPVDNGLLCVKGRFGFDSLQNGSRLKNPLIRKNGELVETSWEEAIRYTAKKAQSLGVLYGSDALAISISDRYTNEEIYLAKKFGSKVLKTDHIFSFNGLSSGIQDVFGYDASTNKFDELLSTDTILLIGSDVIKDHTILGLKIKKAVENGAKLVMINPFDSQADEWSYKKIVPENNLTFLKEMNKALIDVGFAPKDSTASGFSELVQDLSAVEISEIAKEVALLYGKSKKAMIVFDQSNISVDGAKLIANMAVISGHVGKPRSGIIQLKPNNNSQGLVDMGISPYTSEMAKNIEDQKIKGLLIFGEDIPHVDLSKLDFLMVQDTHLTLTAQRADVVLPAVGFAESTGTITNSERRIQKLSQAIPPLSGLQNWKVITKLGDALETNMGYDNPQDILDEISCTIKEYLKVNQSNGENIFWPLDKNPVLYTEGFNFADLKAKLQIVEGGPLFMESTNTNHLSNDFIAFLKKEDLM